MAQRLLDVRLVISDKNEDDKDIPEIIERIKQYYKIYDDREIIKSCIRIAFEKFYQNEIE